MCSPEASFESTVPIQCKDLRYLQNLQEKLQRLAILHVGSDMTRALLAIMRNEFMESRRKIDVPHGFFGLNLEKFYARRKEQENTVYVDVLQLENPATLEQAKICIVLDDLIYFFRNLFSGYECGDMIPTFKEITDSRTFLTIHQTIEEEYNHNTERLNKLQDMLSAFNLRETTAILNVNGQVYAVQNDCVEAELVLEPIEFRYKMSFHQRTTEQSMQKALEIEERLQKTLDTVDIATTREDAVTESIQMKQRYDIEILKAKLDEMSKLYDKEYENLDGQIIYKRNAMETMDNIFKDCTAKLEFYRTDIHRLIKWKENWEKKKREEAEALLRPPKPKKKKKKGDKGGKGAKGGKKKKK